MFTARRHQFNKIFSSLVVVQARDGWGLPSGANQGSGDHALPRLFVPNPKPHPEPETCVPHCFIDISMQPHILERKFFIDNLLVQIHLLIEMILVDRPCAMGV